MSYFYFIDGKKVVKEAVADTLKPDITSTQSTPKPEIPISKSTTPSEGNYKKISCNVFASHLFYFDSN
jgi:hypothetical protein